jgi:hypothetical protein
MVRGIAHGNSGSNPNGLYKFRPSHVKGVRGVGFGPTNPKGMGSLHSRLKSHAVSQAWLPPHAVREIGD